MAQLKFYRKAQAPTSPVEGTIWFNTTDKTIEIYANNTWEKYAGNLKDATWSGSTLTITKQDGSSIALDFSDMASAAVMGKMITAVGLNADGTFKKNATNYGGEATSIGGEIANIDSALRTLNGTVGTNYQTLDSKIETSINNIKGDLKDGDATTLAAINNAIGTLSTNYGNLAGNIENNYATKQMLTNMQSVLEGADATDTPNSKTIAGAKKYADNAIANLDSTKTGENTHVDVTVTQTDGKITSVEVVESDIASATTLAEVKATVDAFFEGAGMDEGEVNTYRDTLKELQTYMTEDAAAASTMAGNISKNTTEISKLAGTKINGKGFTNKVDGSLDSTTIILTGADVKITGYEKGTADDLVVGDTINQALGKLEARVDAAAAGGVQSVNGKTGSITIAEGATNGTISVGGDDVSVAGLKSAAYTESSAYASATDFQNLSTLVGTSSNGTNTGIFKVIEENEKTTASALTDLDTRLQDVESKKDSIESALQASDITTGSANGTISVKGSDIKVKGLGSAAYTEASAYATAAQGAKADTAYQKPEAGIPLTDLASSVYTQAEVDAMWAWAEF